MTVAELIEELKRQPNQHVPVVLAARDRGDSLKWHEPRVRFTGPNVVIEED